MLFAFVYMIMCIFAEKITERLTFLNKPKMRIIIVVILCLIAFPSYIHAQIGRLFNTDNHLSSSFAMHVYQDYDGFIWVSTRNGLNRYDGYNFKVFKKGEYSCDGMKSNYINTVL